jgi:hypothetical protein
MFLYSFGLGLLGGRGGVCRLSWTTEMCERNLRFSAKRGDFFYFCLESQARLTFAGKLKREARDRSSILLGILSKHEG